MTLTKRIPYLAMTLAVGGLLTGCFSYHREVKETTTPATVETVPPAASTTTTTTSNDGTVERRSTSTYSTTP
jgi:hypothetical protein